MDKVNVFWFRRDLRLEDNAGLYHALRAGLPVLPVFIFDTRLLNDLDDKYDRRVSFIYQSIRQLQQQLETFGSSLLVYHLEPVEAFQQIIRSFAVQNVFTNHDYEPYARQRDEQIETFLKTQNTGFYTFKDQVVFEKAEVMKDNGQPYTVFTPYSKKWKEKLDSFYLKPYPTKKYLHHLYKQKPQTLPSLQSLGFEPVDEDFPAKEISENIILDYDKQRDFPDREGTTHMGVHLRFGTISVRMLAQKASLLNQAFLNELIWREFFQMILWHFPQVVNQSFDPRYDRIRWRNHEDEFQKWCDGRTGYPIVDAGMRELNATGFMHNRVRMITASFLTKLLLIDWRWGEAWFAKKLLDYELASNNGNWQWAAGSGCDAAPYFRIFNPYTQAKKFDPHQNYIKKWIHELGSDAYPAPVVDYKTARERALKVYAEGLKEKF